MDVDCRQSSPEALHCQSRLLQWHPSYFKEDEAAPFQTYDTHTSDPAEAMTWFCMAQRKPVPVPEGMAKTLVRLLKTRSESKLSSDSETAKSCFPTRSVQRRPGSLMLL